MSKLSQIVARFIIEFYDCGPSCTVLKSHGEVQIPHFITILNQCEGKV